MSKGPNVVLVDAVVVAVKEYLYVLAGQHLGHVQDLYLDAADALADVVNHWETTEVAQ